MWCDVCGFSPGAEVQALLVGPGVRPGDGGVHLAPGPGGGEQASRTPRQRVGGQQEGATRVGVGEEGAAGLHAGVPRDQAPLGHHCHSDNTTHE